MKRKTTLELAEENYKKLNLKFKRLLRQLDKTIDTDKRAKIEVKIDYVDHLLEQAKLIVGGKKVEQAGRNLVAAGKGIFHHPNESVDIIDTLNNTPKLKSISEEFEKHKLRKEISKIFIIDAYERLKEVFEDILQDYNNDDDDDDETNDDDLEPVDAGPVTESSFR